MPCLLRPICSSAISVAAIAPARRHVTCYPTRVRPRVFVWAPSRYDPACLYTRACTCAHVQCVGSYTRPDSSLCVFLCMLSWLNSCSTETNYNEARLVGRESAMFSFLCPSLYPSPLGYRDDDTRNDRVRVLSLLLARDPRFQCGILFFKREKHPLFSKVPARHRERWNTGGGLHGSKGVA